MQDLPGLLLSYGIKLRQAGNEYSCLCFAHDDHNPSMSVYQKDGKWHAHCFACGYHGDIYAAYCELNGLDTTNPEHFLRAKNAIEGGEIYTGKPFATIEGSGSEITQSSRTMITPDENTPAPKMDWLASRDGTPWGEPEEVFIFRQPNGLPWFYEARWIVPNPDTGELKKQCRCFTYGARGSEHKKWACSHYVAPRPMYGLDILANSPADRQVIITEGPRKAFYAQQLLPMLPCMGWAGGANGWSKSDFLPIAGRPVILWPDADEPGCKCMDELAQHLIDLGCAVHILNTLDMPESWDAADAVKEGWDTAKTLAWAKANKGEPVLKKTPAPEEKSDGNDLLPTDELPPIDAYESNGITWSTPGDIFSEIQPPKYNPEIMPECLREWIEDTASVKGVDPAMLCLSSIVAAAGCLHDAIKVQPERTNPSWTESARLWGAIVGNSGIKKSPAINSAISRVKKIQMDLSAKAADIWDEVRAKEMAFEIANKEYIKALSKNDPAAQEKKPFRPETPEIPRLLFEDVTVEKLGEELKYSSRGAFLLRDELAGWFGSHAQYRSSGSDAPAWLDFYEGGGKYIDRIGRGSIFVENWGGCILGGIQPSTMSKIIEKLPEDGLLQRFIVITARQGEEGSERPYNKDANDRYHSILQQIFDTLPDADSRVLLSEDANAIRKEINAKIRKLISTGMISTGFCSHLSKYEGLFARLALTYHAIDCADKRWHPQSCSVSGQTAEMAKKLMLEFLLPHAISFYINLESQTEIGHAIRKVGELCLVAKSLEIASRDIQRGWIGWRHYRQQDQEIVLQQLVDQGWILPHPRARQSSMGRPTRWLINPAIHEMHAARRAEEIERRKIAVEAIDQCRIAANEGQRAN